MGDFVATGSTAFPLELLSSIVCSFAIAIYALAQPDGWSDDDDPEADPAVTSPDPGTTALDSSQLK